MILGYNNGVRGPAEGEDAADLRRLYQVDSKMPSLNATATAETALRRSKVSSQILRRVNHDDRTIVAMGNGNMRDRLFQTMFASPYDTQIHDWGRDPATDFLEPRATAAVAGGKYAGGGALGNYPIAAIEGYHELDGWSSGITDMVKNAKEAANRAVAQSGGPSLKEKSFFEELMDWARGKGRPVVLGAGALAAVGVVALLARGRRRKAA